MLDAVQFVRNYTEDDRPKVTFESNGEVGPKLLDANRNNRAAICEACMDSPTIASDMLIRDLYDAETAHAKAAWGVWHKGVSFLASQLLARGGELNVRCFLECCGRGMDAYCSSMTFEISTDQVAAAITALDTIAADADERLQKKIEFMRPGFEKRLEMG